MFLTVVTLNKSKVLYLFMFVYDSFTEIATALGMEDNVYPHTDLYDSSWTYNKPDGKHMRAYWASLTPEEKREVLKTHGMTGKTHSEATKAKMSKSMTGVPKPSLHKGGTLIKDGNVVEFTCLSHFCKENGLSSGHMCELLQGKRKTVKGWKLWAH